MMSSQLCPKRKYFGGPKVIVFDFRRVKSQAEAESQKPRYISFCIFKKVYIRADLDFLAVLKRSFGDTHDPLVAGTRLNGGL